MAGPMFDPDAVRLWLRILHEGNPGRIHVASTAAWSGPSYPCSDIDAAVARVVELDAGRPLGIYVRMTSLMAPLGRGQRGGNADSLALPALWADIDIAGPAHKDANLPPDWSAGMRIVATSGLPAPSLTVDSGHGMYPVWLLDPVEVLAADTIVRAGALSADWQRVIAAASERLGYHYGEGVGDLARVLRIPGTVNRKAGMEKLCRLIDGTGGKYALAELHDRCAAMLAQIGPAPTPGPRSRVSSSSPPRTGPVLREAGPGEVAPGDDYAARTTWAEILEPHGWRPVRSRGDVVDWCRPGKDDGISATTNGTGTDRFHCFSTSTGFDVTSYSKFGAYAVLNHGGDHSAAASTLKSLGYGQDGTADVEAYLAGLSDTLPPMPGGQMTKSSVQPDGPDGPATPELDAETLAKLRFQQLVAADMIKRRVSRASVKAIDAEEFAMTWREPTYRRSLTDELAEPDDPIRFRVDRLLTVGGNAVVTAAFKAGKTTLCNNLLRSLADGEQFLGRFDVHPADDRRIAVFNYEVSEGQYRQWLRKIGITDTDRIAVLNLRGFRLPLIHALVEDWISKWLREQEIGTWIVDPFARAMVGCGDENSNMDVGVVLDALDVIKARAGVGELILPTHTGRAEQQAGTERARGATRLDDWADARWLLTTDDKARRFFRANGRDVDVDEELLSFDQDTGRLTMGGHDRRGMAMKDHGSDLVDWIREHPGLTGDEVAAGFGHRRKDTLAAVKTALATRALYTVTDGRRILHYATGTLPTGGGRDAG